MLFLSSNKSVIIVDLLNLLDTADVADLEYLLDLLNLLELSAIIFTLFSIILGVFLLFSNISQNVSESTFVRNSSSVLSVLI